MLNHVKSKIRISQIGNANKTPVCFDMAQNYTDNSRGAKEIKIKVHHVTVMLSITVDGHKLLSYLILNRKVMQKNKYF